MMKASRLAVYGLAVVVVVAALVVLVTSLPPQPSGPDADARVSATPSVPIVFEPFYVSPSPTPAPSPTIVFLY
ncbi:MAG: hypothetical protein JXB47_21160 [Anaerolineae bacterium]|nr:hypothetical protein [Anaerolineae bacterium]